MNSSAKAATARSVQRLQSMVAMLTVLAKVYLGFNVTTGDMLAIKQVEMPQTSSDKDNETQSSVVNALKSEIGMLQDFDHINIVQFLGYNESPEYLSIFLEYVSASVCLPLCPL